MSSSNKQELEEKSSAFTLSDMEIFVFPDLLYSLVLADIMSPRLWQWRDDPWFKDIEKMNPYRRIVRLKQYIMDKYVFNLDLETWGLTTQDTELNRFKDIISPENLRQSNALFGYEGDKYYFDIDIRRHFGLDKYQDEVIPYWKTETIEAMDAFKYKPNYQTGAGECVSLAALYAAALFVVAGIPLKDIYLMATPLHSQNFIDVKEGILTNNRRILTKKMWINGTAISAKARRALENEQVTIVAHETGYIHTLYKEATIDKTVYEGLSDKLKQFLTFELNEEVLVNFLRHRKDLQPCFQTRWNVHGHTDYIGVDRVFAYEHRSPHLFSDNTRKKLMEIIDQEEFHCSPMPNRIILDDLESYVRENTINLRNKEDVSRLREQFGKKECLKADIVMESLVNFCVVTPKLPNTADKHFVKQGEPFAITPDMPREKIIKQLATVRGVNRVAELAFYAYRDFNRVELKPFLYAAMKRNPVSIDGMKDLTEGDLFETIHSWPYESVYGEQARLAQPDEVYNFKQGDGLEKALLMANIVCSRKPELKVRIAISSRQVVLNIDNQQFTFPSQKQLPEQTLDL